MLQYYHDTKRHYGMDWLRIFAFALLILYHICMYFVPWPWHINRIEPVNWIAAPMMAMNSWRLLLLFLVSGYASAALIKRQSATMAFLRERSARLLIPVIFAVIFIIPVQPWIELVTKSGYDKSMLQFWLSDYWAFTSEWGMILPTWQHLWFVCFLWAYTALLIAMIAFIPSAWKDRCISAASYLFQGIGVIVIPSALFILLVLARGIDSVRLDAWVDGMAAHIVFFGSMLFGYYLYNAEHGWSPIRKYWKLSLIIGITAFAIILAVKILTNGEESRWAQILFAVMRPLHGWTTIIALLGFVDQFANHDGAWRAKLTEAVFPFYIIHQSIIVLVAFLILPFTLPIAAEFSILIAVTALGCWLFYILGSSVNWLRPMIGLKHYVELKR